MSGKVIDMRAGDKWTKLGSALWLYRGEHAFIVTKKVHGLNDDPGLASDRHIDETDLPTPEAHAQLREWGYEIRGEPQQHTTGFITTSPVIDGATWTLPPNTEPTKTLGDRVAELESKVSELKKDAEDDDATLDDTFGFIDTRHDKIEARIAKLEALITESRVREIVDEVLAAKSKPAPAPDDWRARCRVWQPTPDEKTKWAVHSPCGKWHLVLNNPFVGNGWYINGGLYQLGRNFDTESAARSALAKAPPPPDVSPEPDWRGLLAELVNAVDRAKETGMCDEESWADLIASPALSSARTKLAAKGGK